MTDSTKDSLNPISVAEANELAMSLTAGRVNVIQSYGKIYLAHKDFRGMIHLLAYQMTIRGITAAVRENDPWPER